MLEYQLRTIPFVVMPVCCGKRRTVILHRLHEGVSLSFTNSCAVVRVQTNKQHLLTQIAIQYCRALKRQWQRNGSSHASAPLAAALRL